mgnify:FL=1
MNVGDLVKVRRKWGQPRITGIIVRTWHDRVCWVYEVRNVKSGLLTHATEIDMEVISESR